MSPDRRRVMSTWSPDSWRAAPAEQQPDWAPGLDRVETELRQMPYLVDIAEIGELTRTLASAAEGRAFVIQAGDCAESFDDINGAHVTRRVGLLERIAASFETATQVRTVAIGRIAGQYAKPRSARTELVDGREIPSFFGHMVNGEEPTPAARIADPARLVEAYYKSAATLNLIRSIRRDGFATDLWASHEALILPYESSALRFDDGRAEWYLSSTHFPWIGDRTRSVTGAHVELLRGIVNPIGIKVGPGSTPRSVVELCEILNPERIPGRVTLIPRMGAGRVHDILPPIVDAILAADHPVVWMSDPMHGNTIRTPGGVKTRTLEDIMSEITDFFAVMEGSGGVPGGLHLECTPDDCLECLAPGDSDLDARRYYSLCDPRLNAEQALSVIRHAADCFNASLLARS